VALKEAQKKGTIPLELADLDQDDFLKADYNALKEIVDKHKKRLNLASS
jgi:hypothetical protein